MSYFLKTWTTEFSGWFSSILSAAVVSNLMTEELSVVIIVGKWESTIRMWLIYIADWDHAMRGSFRGFLRFLEPPWIFPIIIFINTVLIVGTA